MRTRRSVGNTPFLCRWSINLSRMKLLHLHNELGRNTYIHIIMLGTSVRSVGDVHEMQLIFLTFMLFLTVSFLCYLGWEQDIVRNVTCASSL